MLDNIDFLIFCILTLYITIPNFHDPEEECLLKMFQEKEEILVTALERRFCKHWSPAFPFFSTVFITLSQREIIVTTTSNLLSAHAFNPVLSKILSYGKGLKTSYIIKAPFKFSSANAFSFNLGCLQYKSFENTVGKGEIARNIGLLLYFVCQSFNPFPNKPWFLPVCSTSIFKTL